MTKIKFNIATKTLLLLLAFCVCFPALLLEVDAIGADVPCPSSSKAYAVYLYCIEENSALFDKNSDKKISPASTVKLMTAIVAYDNIKDVNATVTITEEMLGGTESNIMKLKVGEKIKIKDIFAGLVCSGYNDAANALVVIACGSISRFVEAMNAKASTLGMNNTCYVDPTGIDDAAETTAYDTMLVAKEFMKSDFLIELSSSPSYELSATNLSSARTLYNRNALISNRTTSKYLNSAAKGMNAGMTSGGGYCVVTSAKKDDRTYICIVMGASYDEESDNVYSYVVANELLDYINKNLGYRVLIEAESEIRQFSIVGARIDTESVSAIITEDVKAYLPSNYAESGLLKISYVYFKEELVASVSKGDVVGNVIVSYADEILTVSEIVIAEDVERNDFIYSLWFTKKVLSSRSFITAAISFAFILLGYLFIYPQFLMVRRKKRNVSKYRYK